MRENTLLVIDDEAEVGAFLAEVAKRAGFEATAVTRDTEFWEAYRASEPEVLILDLMMPGQDGVDLLRQLGNERCSASIILVSGYDARVLNTARQLTAAKGLDIVAAVQKPVKAATLRELLGGIRERHPVITEADLRQALSGGQFIVHYQPKVGLNAHSAARPDADRAERGRESRRFGPRPSERAAKPLRLSGAASEMLRSGDRNGVSWPLDGFEALVRWRRPQQGLVSPDGFVPLAEQSGLVRPLTNSVLGLVLEQLGHWAKNELLPRVAFNVSAKHMSDTDFPDRLAELVSGHGVDPGQLVLEVTETGVMDDVARSMDTLSRIRLKGFALSMDDFGTGYSSLLQLYRMPFSELKVDQSLVRELGRSEEAGVIVGAIIELAHKLGMSVCAEGTESPEALDFLIAAGCDKAQGYYFSKPRPADELVQYLDYRSDT